ncbi:MAG: hypothetical protein JNL32_11900 [Candidatus Kapabacteria bacterium]|nr:hypothetical protein [Candidatus Kapabacteria bacterium]
MPRFYFHSVPLCAASLILMLIAAVHSVVANDYHNETPPLRYRTILNLELGGASGGGGIMFEGLTQESMSIRVGIFGLMPLPSRNVQLSFPVVSSYLIGTTAHRLEIGAGLTYQANTTDDMPSWIAPVANLCYRYQEPRNNGWIFRAGIMYPGFRNAIPLGISIGWRY